MFLRLRDISEYDRYVATKVSKEYIDPLNLKFYFIEENIDKLPQEIRDRLLLIPKVYSVKLFDIVLKFIEKEKYDYPIFLTFLKYETEQRIIAELLSYIHCTEFEDDWDQFAEKFIIKEVEKWCIENNIPYSM